jgi:cystathionine gamma-synthase
MHCHEISVKLPTMTRFPDIETTLAQAGHFVDQASGAIVAPIQLSTTFARDAAYQLPGQHSYARAGTPGTAQLEQLLAKLDDAADAMVFSSGMAGIVAVLESVTPGQRISAPSIMYHGTRDWLNHIATQRNLSIDWYNAGEQGALERSLRPGETALVWAETATNPVWDVTYIKRAAPAAHDVGARLAVDSTVAPPVTCKPLQLGADYVFHSATKYLNGHSDVTAGVVCTALGDTQWDAMRLHRTLTGTTLAPFEAWLLGRGLRTLALRFARASDNAMAIAEHFSDHRAVDAVLYPGLASHPGHCIAAAQMRNGFGGMMSILVRGDAQAALAVVGKLRVFARATSLGGVESLVEHRATVEGPRSPVPKNLLRLSIGIESADDLIADLEQALG